MLAEILLTPSLKPKLYLKPVYIFPVPKQVVGPIHTFVKNQYLSQYKFKKSSQKLFEFYLFIMFYLLIDRF